MRKPFRTVCALLLLFVAVDVAIAIVFRRGDPKTLARIRRWNQQTLNPWMMKRAGGEHFYASVVHHTGRTSGKDYATPVVVHHADDAYLIPLPYGEKVDWLQNVLAADTCRLTHRGQDLALIRPRVVDRTVAASVLANRERMRYRLFGVDRYVLMDLDHAPAIRHGAG